MIEKVPFLLSFVEAFCVFQQPANGSHLPAMPSISEAESWAPR